jgi:hypothetical protein
MQPGESEVQATNEQIGIDKAQCRFVVISPVLMMNGHLE